MEAYTSFARVYDTFMDNIPYEEWCEYLTGLMREYGVRDGLVLDLGCGTGNMTELLAKAGYDMIGADNAEEMLEIAMEKRDKSGYDILYLLQDMREFELPYEVDAFVSIGDSMNYITTNDDLCDVFKCVKNGLKPGGIFIFDLKTIHFFKDILSDNTYAENREDSAFIWDNYYDDESANNEYELAVFVRNEDGTFDRFEEQHYQHGFTMAEVENAVKKAGLKIRYVYDAFTHNEPAQESERLYYIVEHN